MGTASDVDEEQVNETRKGQRFYGGLNRENGKKKKTAFATVQRSRKPLGEAFVLQLTQKGW